jgi:uncharacterized protein (TIGR02147 family)
MPNIFSYINFRTYLTEYYAEKKAENSRFSYRMFSRICSFSSPNFIKLIAEGKRNLSTDGIEKVAKGLKLNKNESRFFTNLVHFNQSSSHEDKKRFYEKLSYFKSFKEIKKIEHEFYRYLSKWLYPVIREMTLLKNFNESPSKIAEQVTGNITEDEVKEAIQMLRDLEFIQPDKRNRLRATDKTIKTDPEVLNVSVKNFHKEMIGKAMDSMDETAQELRDISALTIAVNKKTFLETKKRIQEFRDELNVMLSKSTDVDAVYQLNFQFFNLTKPNWKK